MDHMRGYTTVVRVFSGGKVTIPKSIRDAMRLQDGDLVEITIRIVEEDQDRETAKPPA
jgi:AbrB family looped-hinge helix DNA binding protein